MALYFPGTRGLILPAPTPQFRYDMGFVSGRPAVSLWIKPDVVNEDQEIWAIAETGTGFQYILCVFRMEGASVGAGSCILIQQADLFGFCAVRRCAAGTLTAGVWQHVLCAFEVTMADAHVYVDGVEATYTFSRSEIGLPMQGGGDIILGGKLTGIRPMGLRVNSGDANGGWVLDPALVYATYPGNYFRGAMAHAGWWGPGLANAGFASGIPTSLAAGYSPLFMNHKIDSSSFSPGLLMHLGLYGEAVNEQCAVSGIAAEETPDGSGHLSWVPGPPVVEPCPPEIDAPGPVVAKTPRLCLPFGLPRAELYRNPGNPADLLPIVYGDFRVGGISGPIPATLIDQPDPLLDTSAFTYCAAYHPTISIDKVYIGDIEQVFSLFTVDPTAPIVVSLSNNFQGRGTIATIAFVPDASNRMLSPEGQPLQPVSWRGQGLYDRTGLVLMENCVDQLVHLLTTWGNFEENQDFDLTALAEARAAVDTLGYKTAFVVFSEAVTQDWLTEMLFNVMGYWRINGIQQLEIHIDVGAGYTAADLSAEVIAARDCLDGDDGVQFVLDKQHLVNKLTAYYLWNYATSQASSRLVDLIDETSLEAYGEIAKAVTLKGLRRAEDVAIWALILLARQSARTRVEGGMLVFSVEGGKFAHLTIGDLVAFTWPYGPTRENNNPYANEILRILNLSLDPSRGGAMQITAADLGLFLTSGGVRVTSPVSF